MTVPISVQKYTFASRGPTEIERIYLFWSPFSFAVQLISLKFFFALIRPQTWISIGIMLFTTALTLYVINTLNPTKDAKHHVLCKFKHCFWYVLGALLQQGIYYY